MQSMQAASRLQAQRGPQRLEAVVAEGLEAVARAEIRRLGRGIHFVHPTTVALPGALIFDYDGDLRALLGLQTVNSIYLARSYPVPRPKALLGDEHFRALLGQIETVRRLSAPGSFATLYISAAGSETTVLRRLRAELAARCDLSEGEEDGDLFLRVRRTPGGPGWDVLVRLTPRPLATRPWRVCNMEGALNGAVARAIVWLTRPDPRDRYLNIGCGSGTLLIERLLSGPARQAIGCDISREAITCTQTNLAAAHLTAQCELHQWDARALPLPEASIDVVTADLPFGHLVGSHQENLTLYPALLREAARVTRPGASCALLSHEVRLMEQLLDEPLDWKIEEIIRIGLGGLHPRIYLLQRR